MRTKAGVRRHGDTDRRRWGGAQGRRRALKRFDSHAHRHADLSLGVERSMKAAAPSRRGDVQPIRSAKPPNNLPSRRVSDVSWKPNRPFRVLGPV